MKAKHTDLEKLEQLYKESGNQLVVLYGRRGCQKEELIKEFCDGKKFFYYRCRQASPEHQLEMMGEEISRQYKVSLSRQTYEEYFARIKSGDPSKLVVIIDEAQFVAKRDASFMEAVAKLKKHKLYPGPVLIILATSSTVWATQEAAEQFKGAEMKLESLNFLEVVRHFESLPVAEIVRIYGAIGGVPAYLDKWDAAKSFKDNICRLVLTPSGALYGEVDAVIAAELRELSAYSTILAAIARGENKLNDIFHATGFSRAKISVYLKNLANFNIVEKVVSFETGGWENAKKGVYQIKDTFVNFWFKFVYPNMSNLYLLSPEEFYDTYIEKELDAYLERYFREVCTEYLLILNQMGQLPFTIKRVGTWIGKTGRIDIVAQSEDRRSIIGFCNWDKPMMTMDMCENMAMAMEQARLTSDDYYLFSATDFEPALQSYVVRDPRFKLINMNEL